PVVFEGVPDGSHPGWWEPVVWDRHVGGEPVENMEAGDVTGGPSAPGAGTFRVPGGGHIAFPGPVVDLPVREVAEAGQLMSGQHHQPPGVVGWRALSGRCRR